jgi:hypothetical protein
LNQEETIEIFSVLLQSLKNKGLKKTINILKGESIPLNNIEFDSITKFIVDAVCFEFNIDFSEITNTKYSRGDNKYVIGFIVYYLCQQKSLRVIQQNVFINLTKALLSTYKQLIFDLDKDKLNNERYIAMKKILDNKINKIKNGKS